MSWGTAWILVVGVNAVIYGAYLRRTDQGTSAQPWWPHSWSGLWRGQLNMGAGEA